MPALKQNVGNDESWFNPDDVVISGISARLPQSNSIEEFKKNLYDCVDMVTVDDRLPPSVAEFSRMGNLKNMEHFDAAFFGVHTKQAEVMDPQGKLLLECTYEAIVDAGVNPETIRGSKTGVYLGATMSDMEEYVNKLVSQNSYGLLGCLRSMFANRISYCFDLKGPSYSLDTGCSSSLYALQQALNAIRSGECEAAIVGGSSLTLNPWAAYIFTQLGMLSPDGMCKTFDESVDGYVRSNAIAVVYLQKASVAKRNYCTVVNAMTNTDGAKEEGITFPSGIMQARLVEETYDQVNVNPASVAYVEAHGTGTPAGDPQEMNGLTEVFCKGRNSPLLIGSVKSNMGHSEPASGLCSIVKVILGMENKLMPPNLHFKNPNKEIPGLLDGRLQVVDRPWPFEGGYVGINSFGIGGANAHVLLKSNPKPKESLVKDEMPRLVCVSGRTEEAVNYMLDKIISEKNDNELVALIHEIHEQKIHGHNYRGFTILNDESAKEVESYNDNDGRPTWFVFSGMGSQWAGMAKDLFRIKQFEQSIRKCADVLMKEGGFDLLAVLKSEDESTFENILNSLVSITSIQVALVDVLKSIGIEPDGMLGHSVGELGCAYADGTFTVDQTVTAAYWRGRVILESNLPAGAMAAVGLSWEETIARAPADVLPACHNSAESVTISGPPESIKKFCQQLTSEGIFAKEVKSSGYAFHSKYIAAAGPALSRHLERIIPNPKPRSSKWICTCIPESEWNSPVAQFSSAAYHDKNLLSPVLFHEALKHVPKNAILIEIAPHALLQAILKRALGSDATILGLQKRGDPDNLEFFLTSIGKYFNAGGHPKLKNLYPSVKFPVSKGTSMIQSMVQWDHSVTWPLPDYSDMLAPKKGEVYIDIDINEDDVSYYLGYKIEGQNIFPATGYLTLVWMTHASQNGKKETEFPVVIENAQFLRDTIMSKDEKTTFCINISRATGDFEVSESDCLVMKGNIRYVEDASAEVLDLKPPLKPDNGLLLTKEDVYKELNLRGYDYSGVFRGIEQIDNHVIDADSSGMLNFDGNYVTFLDNMIQFAILQGKKTRELYLPVGIQRVVIDPLKQTRISEARGDSEGIPVYNYPEIGVLVSGGLEMRGLKFSSVPRQEQKPAPRLEKYLFLPYDSDKPTPGVGLHETLFSVTGLTMENNPADGIFKFVEAGGDTPFENLLASQMIGIANLEAPLVEYTVATNIDISEELKALRAKEVKKNINNGPVVSNHHLAIGFNLTKNNTVLTNMAACVKVKGFVLTVEDGPPQMNSLAGLEPVYKAVVENNKTVLLLRKVVAELPPTEVIHISTESYKWVEDVKAALARSEDEEDMRVLLVAQENVAGIIGLVNCLVQEPGGINLRSVFIQNSKTPFSIDSPVFASQLKKDLTHNILKGNVWGAYRHLPLERSHDEPIKKVEHAYINTLVRGDLTSLKWIEGPLTYYTRENYPNTELCSVYYAPLNYRDIMLASGALPPEALPVDHAQQECLLGVEFSGRDSKGKRVMGMVAARSLATTVIADAGLLWEVPSNWTLEQASSVPVVYATAYYALLVRGRMEPGESLLVHAGAGGVGQAAISIALHMGCTVYTTVGSKEKRDYLKKAFPKLTDANIANSRDTTFEQHVLKQTKGRGVDLVLNSLADDKLKASIRCLAKDGRFLEIGKLDLSKDSPLGMSLFLKNTLFHGIQLDTLFDGASDNAARKAVVKLFTEGLKNGVIKPLPTHVFSEDQVEEAFRFLGNGKHVGKVVIKVRDEEPGKVTKPTKKLVTAVPRTYMNPNKCYLLVGGLGGFGLELANWMIIRGARKIVLTSRRGITTGYQTLCMRRWQERGAKVLISTAECGTIQSTEQLIKEANSLGPIGGIFNLAAVLRDALIENQTPEDYETVCKPKVIGTKNLDIVSRKHCPSLDYFVMFSSMAAGRGNPGQSNYCFANSVMERICEARQADGLPGTAIQWGAIGDTGIFLDTGGANDSIIGGTLPQRMPSCLTTIDIFLQQPQAVMSSMVVMDKTKFAIGDEEEKEINIIDVVAGILGFKDTKNVNMSSTLAKLGMDSLMGTEIRQTLLKNYNIKLGTAEVRQLTLSQLLELQENAPAQAEADDDAS